jgi:4-hydroxybutyryl-CoA dehydratase/vinylacetyl-CoA-Delta-isomerase
VDKALGTKYAANVEAYRRYLQDTDASLALAMTDVKGDRSLRPSQQEPHQDYYVRIVEERPDGIVVRGAKAHISEAPLCNELIVLPCRAMKEDDADYAVSFGVPANAPGLTMISAEPEVKEAGNFFDYPISSALYINDAMIIFDDVFIPNERIFLKGDWQFAGQVAHMFGNFHRLSAETYKAAELELVAGAAALMAEYNGVDRAGHIKDKLMWLTYYTEAVEILGLSAVEHSVSDPDSGLAFPNPMHANVAKYFFADNWHQAIKHVQDIAGGIVATAPSALDYQNPELRPLIDKYLGAKLGVPTEHRLRLIKLIRDLGSSYEDVITLHAEGSLAAQRLSISELAPLDRYKAAVKRAARIDDGSYDQVYSELPVFPPSVEAFLSASERSNAVVS